MDRDKFVNKKLAVIGGGHMGLALVEGFMNSGKVAASQLIVANPSLSKITHLEKLDIETTTDNKLAARKADWIFLAVKPFVIDQVLTEIGNLLKGKLIISLAAVVTIKNLRKQGKNVEIVRIIPNMGIACNRGVIGLFADGQDQKEIVELLSLLGLVIETEKEEELDALTLLSGCGLAIVSQFIEILANYGIKIDLSSDMSHKLVLRTFESTVVLLEKSARSPNQVIQSVATKGGITETILNNLQQGDFQNSFTRAMDEGYSKIKELRQKLKD